MCIFAINPVGKQKPEILDYNSPEAQRLMKNLPIYSGFGKQARKALALIYAKWGLTSESPIADRRAAIMLEVFG